MRAKLGSVTGDGLLRLSSRVGNGDRRAAVGASEADTRDEHGAMSAGDITVRVQRMTETG
jgi:hypothetical protein